MGWLKLLSGSSYDQKSYAQSSAGAGNLDIFGTMGDTGRVKFASKMEYKDILINGVIFFLIYQIVKG